MTLFDVDIGCGKEASIFGYPRIWKYWQMGVIRNDLVSS